MGVAGTALLDIEQNGKYLWWGKGRALILVPECPLFIGSGDKRQSPSLKPLGRRALPALSLSIFLPFVRLTLLNPQNILVGEYL
jgi:hypothetical protein